jgi:hypothetical protein
MSTVAIIERATAAAVRCANLGMTKLATLPKAERDQLEQDIKGIWVGERNALEASALRMLSHIHATVDR